MNRRQTLATLAAAAALWPAAAPAALRKPWPRQARTPGLQLPVLDGAPWALAAEKGHPVLLNFWASWCEPCRAEMPSLERLAESQRATGLKIIPVNFKEGEPAIRKFLAATPMALPLVRDTDGAAAKAFGINIFPSTVAIDRKGRALFTIVGEVDWSGPEGLGFVSGFL